MGREGMLACWLAEGKGALLEFIAVRVAEEHGGYGCVETLDDLIWNGELACAEGKGASTD